MSGFKAITENILRTTSKSLRFISPYFIGIVIFLIMYIRLCTNDSNMVGNEYFELGNYQKALNLYNEYLELYPHDIKTLYNRGRCFEELGHPSRAAEDFEKVLDREPDNVKALLSLSQYYYNEGKYQSAVNLCAAVTMIEKENYLAHYFKARAHHKNGDVREAIEEYNTVVDLNPDFGFAYFHRSSIWLSIGLQPFGCYDLQTADSLRVKGAREAFYKYCR